MKKIITIISIFFISLNNIYAQEKVTFKDCVDGDTFKVTINNEDYTVRMLAIDTPESVHPTKGIQYYGKEASTYTCDTLKKAKSISLEYDDASDKLDKYNRLLAWIFVDNELLQEKLVENGYAKVAYLYGDYKYTKLLQEKQELASAKNIGIWDTEAASKYDGESMSTDDANKTKDYSTMEIVIMVFLLLIIVFVGDKSIKNKAKKKLKGYLK